MACRCSMDVKKMKARELADRGRCVQNADGTWTVSSLNSSSKYRVALNSANGDKSAPRHTCSCPHFETIQSNCKHIRSVLIVIAENESDERLGHEPRSRVPDDEARQFPR